MDLYLAPINTLSNNSFRKLCLDYGADFVFTEMVWAERILEGMVYEERKLDITNQDKTIIQIIAKEAKNIEPFVSLLKKRFPNIKELNFNMGCPQITLLRKNLGGGILKDKKKMTLFCDEFAKACKKHGFTPSIKMRMGVHAPEVDEFLKIIKDAGIKKVYIHARTLHQGYIKKADYTPLKEVSGVEFIINGDITDKASYEKAISITKCSGVMIGREALRNPSIFLKLKNKKPVSKKEAMLSFLDHSKDLRIDLIKKNICWMTNGMLKGGPLRGNVDKAKTLELIRKTIEDADIR